MALNKYKIGELIKQRKEKYNGIDELPIRGVTREGFIPPKQLDADTSLYNVFYKGDFVFNPARMELNSIAYNSDFEKAMCSSLYEIFYVVREDLVLPEYLNLFIKRMEFARKCWFLAIGSARNYFRIPDLSELEIDLPSIEIQKKYVDIYKGLKHNLKVYQSKLEDIKMVYEGYIEKLRREINSEKIGPYIREVNVKNENGKIKLFQGVTVDHVFAEPKRVANDSDNGNVVMPNQFAFNKVMKSNNTKLPIALRKGEPCVISGSYQVFEICKEGLIPDYLMMWFDRAETQRYAGFISFGTTRDIFTIDNMKEIKIPIPEVKIQNDVIKIHNSYIKRKNIVDRLKEKINNICPILVRGAVKEAKNG